MKKLFLFILVCLLAVPGSALAEQIKVSGDQAKVLGYGLEFDTARQGKVAVTMGREVIFLNEALTSASFKKDAEHPLKHDLYYSCMGCDKHRRTPGKCKCGANLEPSVKHGKEWHLISRDAEGKLTVGSGQKKACACQCGCDCQHPCTPEACANCPTCKNCTMCQEKCAKGNPCGSCKKDGTCKKAGTCPKRQKAEPKAGDACTPDGCGSCAQ